MQIIGIISQMCRRENCFGNRTDRRIFHTFGSMTSSKDVANTRRSSDKVEERTL